MSDNKAVEEVRLWMADVCRLLNEEFLTQPEAMLGVYNDAEDIRLFDMMAPIQTKGDTFIEHFWKVAPYYTGVVRMFDVKIEAKDDLAFVSMIQTYTGSDKSGHTFEYVYRVTDCCKKIDGKWRIVHEHLSLPVADMVEGKTQLWSKFDDLPEFLPAKSKVAAAA